MLNNSIFSPSSLSHSLFSGWKRIGGGRQLLSVRPSTEKRGRKAEEEDPRRREIVFVRPLHQKASRTKNKTDHKGVIKIWNSAKGWGFVTDDATKEDVFLHVNNFKSSDVTFKTLTPGQKVSFNVERRVRGLVARDLIVEE